MKSDAERDLRAAEEAMQEVVKARQDADAKQRQAKEMKAQAEKERDQVVAEAHKKAQEILEQARAATEQETLELRRQAFKEVRTILTRVENMKAAVNEELETQRILTNVTRLKANSSRLLTDAGHEDLGVLEADQGAPAPEAIVDGESPTPNPEDANAPT